MSVDIALAFRPFRFSSWCRSGQPDIQKSVFSYLAELHMFRHPACAGLVGNDTARWRSQAQSHFHRPPHSPVVVTMKTESGRYDSRNPARSPRKEHSLPCQPELSPTCDAIYLLPILSGILRGFLFLLGGGGPVVGPVEAKEGLIRVYNVCK